MNKEDIAIIKKSWEIPKADPVGSGSAILIKYFTKYPSNLEKFNAFNDTPVPELRNNKRFVAHCTRIIRTFDESVDALDSENCMEKLHEIWSTIAKTHVKRKIEKPAYVELRECVLEVLTDACKLDQHQAEVWTKFVDTAYHVIYTTMDQLAKE